MRQSAVQAAAELWDSTPLIRADPDEWTEI
jgi:hypothetical protein